MAPGSDQESVSSDTLPPPHTPIPLRFTHTDRHAEASSLRDAARRSPGGVHELRIVAPTFLVRRRKERTARRGFLARAAAVRFVSSPPGAARPAQQRCVKASAPTAEMPPRGARSAGFPLWL